MVVRGRDLWYGMEWCRPVVQSPGFAGDELMRRQGGDRERLDRQVDTASSILPSLVPTSLFSIQLCTTLSYKHMRLCAWPASSYRSAPVC